MRNWKLKLACFFFGHFWSNDWGWVDGIGVACWKECVVCNKRKYTTVFPL